MIFDPDSGIFYSNQSDSLQFGGIEKRAKKSDGFAFLLFE